MNPIETVRAHSMAYKLARNFLLRDDFWALSSDSLVSLLRILSSILLAHALTLTRQQQQQQYRQILLSRHNSDSWKKKKKWFQMNYHKISSNINVYSIKCSMLPFNCFDWWHCWPINCDLFSKHTKLLNECEFVDRHKIRSTEMSNHTLMVFTMKIFHSFAFQMSNKSCCVTLKLATHQLFNWCQLSFKRLKNDSIDLDALKLHEFLLLWLKWSNDVGTILTNNFILNMNYFVICIVFALK